METFENLEKFDDWEKARERAKQIKGVVIKYKIERADNGKYNARVVVCDAFDELTQYVFVSAENGERVRNVLSENGNTFYEDAEVIDISKQFRCKSFREAKEKVAEVIEKIIENRKKVRQTEQQEEAYVVF